MTYKFDDITGRKFGRLLVVFYKGLVKTKTQWSCLCECGRSLVVSGGALRRGNTKSCGCLRRDLLSAKMRTHGQGDTSTYRTWSLMKARCQNPNFTGYKYYGARGITVCARWERFEAFLEDMGARPDGLSLDRINNDGNYGPENCRWATQAQQNANKRKPRRYEAGIREGLELAARFMLSRKVLASEFYAQKIRELAMVSRP